MLGLAILAVASLAFELNVGFTAILVATSLALVAPGSAADAEDRVSWSTVLLVCGIVTHVGVMQQLGTIDWLGQEVATLANPLLAVPFMAQGQVGAVGMVSAIAVAKTIVDTSPFSTNGALVVANAPAQERPALLRQLVRYSAAIALVGPLLAWLVFVAWG